jgi:hypothetical protein
MNTNEIQHQVTQDVITAARANPNGWVYKIEGNFGPSEYVPPEAIVGAWKVDQHGILTGEFFPNKKYIQNFSKIG